MDTNTRRILKLAAQVRAEAEARVGPSIVDEEHDLGGECAHCSVDLFCRALKAGLKIKLAHNTYHCFNILEIKGKDYILDLTATQFGETDHILLKKVPPEKVKSSWETHKVFKSINELKNDKPSGGWHRKITSNWIVHSLDCKCHPDIVPNKKNVELSTKLFFQEALSHYDTIVGQ